MLEHDLDVVPFRRTVAHNRLDRGAALRPANVGGFVRILRLPEAGGIEAVDAAGAVRGGGFVPQA